MAITAEMSLDRTEVNDLNASITIKMPVSDWIEIHNTINEENKYPHWKVASSIRELLDKFRKDQYVFVEDKK